MPVALVDKQVAKVVKDVLKVEYIHGGLCGKGRTCYFCKAKNELKMYISQQHVCLNCFRHIKKNGPKLTENLFYLT